MIKAFPFIHQPDQVVQKTIDVSAADCQYQTHKKKIIFFHVCCYRFSQGWKSLYNTIVYVINFGGVEDALCIAT